MKRKIQLIIILNAFGFSLEAQVTDSVKHKDIVIKRALRLLAGYSLGTYSYADIGISKNSSTSLGYHAYSSACFVSTEIKLGGKFIIGPKIGFWAAGGVSACAIGLNMIYYTDFSDGSLVFRPEIGFGFDKIKVVYGYNANLSKFRLYGINQNLVGLTYCFKVKQLKERISK